MHVVVVGAGVVGLCCAWYLSKDGHEVTVVERNGPEGDKCSLGNSGIIVPSHFVPLAAPGMVASGLKMMAKRASPFRIKPGLDPDLAEWCLLFARHCTRRHVENCAPLLLEMHLRSKELFLDLERELGDEFGLTQKGMLMVCETADGLQEETHVAEMGKGLGLRVRVVDGKDIGKIEPNIQINALGAVHYEDDCHVAPDVFVNLLRHRLAEGGVTFRWNCGGLDLDANPSDLYEFDAIIVAAGAWSGKVAKSMGLAMPIQPGKGLNVTLEAPDKSPQTAMLLKEARVAVTPMMGALRFGGTMELGEWSPEPDAVRAKGLFDSVPKFLPDFPAAALEGRPVWTGLRPCSPDGMPYIGPTRASDGNVFFATGHGMMGLSLGPVTGQLIADMVSGRATIEQRLSPDRFDAGLHL
ncbi:MAG: FAD-dependent oxidoreductase [Armatimonadetes bacterium]|nr:FAD-dependent oxidoreductase [Armatimonadota bacterium]